MAWTTHGHYKETKKTVPDGAEMERELEKGLCFLYGGEGLRRTHAPTLIRTLPTDSFSVLHPFGNVRSGDGGGIEKY